MKIVVQNALAKVEPEIRLELRQHDNSASIYVVHPSGVIIASIGTFEKTGPGYDKMAFRRHTGLAYTPAGPQISLDGDRISVL